jgi:hypothetical protein
MQEIEFKIKGYEAIQTISKDGDFGYHPLTWDGKHVIIILVEPIEED